MNKAIGFFLTLSASLVSMHNASAEKVCDVSRYDISGCLAKIEDGDIIKLPDIRAPYYCNIDAPIIQMGVLDPQLGFNEVVCRYKKMEIVHMTYEELKAVWR